MPIRVEGHRAFLRKVSNFPEEVYSFKPNSHLFRLMWVLLEDPGVGQLKKYQVIARLGEHMGGTNFSDLDTFFGNPLGVPRTPEEQYTYDPHQEQLTIDQWNEVQAKDSQYRERLRMFMMSIIRGATNEGIALAAEAVCGVPCNVYELHRSADGLGIGSGLGRLEVTKEFVVVPLSPITLSQERAVYRAIERLQPPNTVCTVNSTGLEVHADVEAGHAASPSEFYEMRRYIVQTSRSDPGKNLLREVFWGQSGDEVEGRSFAHMRVSEAAWSLNQSVVSVTAETRTPTTTTPIINPVDYNQEFGPWRELERADSPDNYPDGKYPQNPNRYNDAGEYVFAWASQDEYEAALLRRVEALGGEVEGVRYRLPTSASRVIQTAADPSFSLGRSVVLVESTYYPLSR